MKEQSFKDLLKQIPIEKHRLVSADVAELILHFYEDRYPNDDRARKAIEAARSGDLEAMDIARSVINDARVRIVDPSYSPSYYSSRYAARAAYWCCITDCSTIAAERAAACVYVCSKEAYENITAIVKKYIGDDDE